MNNKIFTLGLWDLYKGVITGALSTGLLALLVAVQGLLSKNGLTWTMEDLQGLALAFLLSSIGYLIKNFFENSEGTPFTKEPTE